jgi:hypothetical protein
MKRNRKVYYQNNKSKERRKQFKQHNKKLLQKAIDKNNRKPTLELGLTIYFD